MNKLIFSAVAATVLALSGPAMAQGGDEDSQAGSAYRHSPQYGPLPGTPDYYGNSGFPPQPQQQMPYAYGNRVYPYGPYVAPANPYPPAARANRRDRDWDGVRNNRDRDGLRSNRDRDGDGVRNNRDSYPDDPNRR